MEAQEVLDAINEIGSCEDDVQRRTLLDNLRNGIQPDYTKLAELEKANQELSEKNDKLSKANMDLFLQIPSKKSEDNNDNNPDNQGDEETKKLKYEDLFNEKGDLK